MTVEKITFLKNMEPRDAFVSVRFGDLTIHGITVWKGDNGRLRVFLPSHRGTYDYIDTIELPSDLRSELEADVIAAYKHAKSEADSKNLEHSQGAPTIERTTR